MSRCTAASGGSLLVAAHGQVCDPRARDFGHDLVAIAKFSHDAVYKDQDLVHETHDLRLVGDDDDGLPVGLHSLNCPSECGFTLPVEVGIGFVEDDEARTAI